MLEMVVADDLRPMTSGEFTRGPTKRLVPAPHKASPSVAARPPSPPAAAAPASAAAPPAAAPQQQQQLNGFSAPGTGSTSIINGSSSSKVAPLAPGGADSGTTNGASATNGSGPLMPPMVQQLVSLQTSNKMVSAELLSSQRQVQQQQLELKAARTELA